MSEKDFSSVAYTLGILSIVFGVLNSLAGLVIGIVGFKLSKKQKTLLSTRATKLNKIGIIVSIIFLIISLAITIYLSTKGLNTSSFQLP